MGHVQGLQALHRRVAGLASRGSWGALFVDSTLNTTKKDASRFQNHFQLVLCCHLTHVMPQISRSTRSSDASPPAEGQPPSSSRAQGACKSARNCNTRDLGEAQNKALVAPRHGSRPVNATPPATSRPRAALLETGRSRSLSQSVGRSVTLAELGPRVPTENTTLALVLDTLENRVSCCLARCIGGMATAGLLCRSELVGFAGVPATPALGDCPHLIKDRGRCAASPVSFRSRHLETSRDTVNALRRTHTQ